MRKQFKSFDDKIIKLLLSFDKKKKKEKSSIYIHERSQ